MLLAELKNCNVILCFWLLWGQGLMASPPLFSDLFVSSMARGAVFEKALVRISVFHKHGIG